LWSPSCCLSYFRTDQISCSLGATEETAEPVRHFVSRWTTSAVLLMGRAGHVERYQLQSYRFKPFFVTL
jgi:hypothetical protein